MLREQFSRVFALFQPVGAWTPAAAACRLFAAGRAGAGVPPVLKVDGRCTAGFVWQTSDV